MKRLFSQLLKRGVLLCFGLASVFCAHAMITKASRFYCVDGDKKKNIYIFWYSTQPKDNTFFELGLLKEHLTEFFKKLEGEGQNIDLLIQNNEKECTELHKHSFFGQFYNNTHTFDKIKIENFVKTRRVIAQKIKTSMDSGDKTYKDPNKKYKEEYKKEFKEILDICSDLIGSIDKIKNSKSNTILVHCQDNCCKDVEFWLKHKGYTLTKTITPENLSQISSNLKKKSDVNQNESNALVKEASGKNSTTDGGVTEAKETDQDVQVDSVIKDTAHTSVRWYNKIVNRLLGFVNNNHKSLSIFGGAALLGAAYCYFQYFKS